MNCGRHSTATCQPCFHPLCSSCRHCMQAPRTHEHPKTRSGASSTGTAARGVLVVCNHPCCLPQNTVLQYNASTLPARLRCISTHPNATTVHLLDGKAATQVDCAGTCSSNNSISHALLAAQAALAARRGSVNIPMLIHQVCVSVYPSWSMFQQMCMLDGFTSSCRHAAHLSRGTGIVH